MKKMVFRNGSGQAEYPPDHLRLIELRAGEDELEAVQRYMSGDPTLNNYIGVMDMPDTFLRNRHFRMTWRHSSGIIGVDLPLAREIRLREIRIERDERLVESDKEKNRLDDLGTPEQIAAHKVYRQQLRDLPVQAEADLAAITTAAGLDQYQPAWPK